MITLFMDTALPDLIVVKIMDGKKESVCLQEKQKFGSQVLLGLIHEALKKAKLKFKDLGEIRVNPGPGSFTGLKVGASIAQALGFALNIPVNGKVNKPVELKYT
jgi:tRNA threonylcarbamoyladenosine biosynthesis protein TsaB